jgi:hypothetical protein
MCEDNATREWIEKTLKHSPIFLVVGLITVTQAAVGQGQQENRKISASVATSVPETVTQGARGFLNIGIDTSAGRETGAISSFIAPGERVIGVQYRKIKFRLFSSNKADTAFLENNPHRWVMLFGGDRAGSDDILEADLEDTIDLSELELEEDGDVIKGNGNEIVWRDEVVRVG